MLARPEPVSEALPSAGLVPGFGRAQDLKLDAGSASAAGVTVQEVTVGPNVGRIVIDRSRGVQVGAGNRQLNDFKFRFEQPRVSVADLVSGDPARQRAFENLVEHPNSMIANWAFRHQMAAEAAPAGPVRFISTSAPGMTRIDARLDERGELVVSRSQGIQVGSGVTQHNDFGYRMVKSDLSLEPVLRDNPRLARSLALTVRYPGNAAVQRSFAGRLADAYESPTRSFPEPSALLRGTIGIDVGPAAGVQLGSGNTRIDRIDVSMRRVVVTGWTPPNEVTQPGADGAARPPAAAASPSPDPVDHDPVNRTLTRAARLQALLDVWTPPEPPPPKTAIDDVDPIDDVGPLGGFSAF